MQPLRRAYATAREPLDATDHASTTRSPSTIGAQSSAIKPRPSVALALSYAPPPPCDRPQHTLAKREEGGEEEGGKRKYRSRCREEDREITGAGADDTTRHGFRSYTASTLHCTAILSPSTPTVSRMPLRPLLSPLDTSTHGRTP